jgi:uncharacterized SAM-dependent methyltransferase
MNHRFVKNGLKHANRVLGREAFDLDKWRVVGDWDAEKGAHNQNYCPRVNVSLEGVRIAAGRKLRAVCSHKYDAADRDALCQRAGLHVLDSWSSENDYSKRPSFVRLHMLTKRADLLYLTSK